MKNYKFVLKVLSNFDVIRDNNSDFNRVLELFVEYFNNLSGLDEISIQFVDFVDDKYFFGVDKFDEKKFEMIKSKHRIALADGDKCIYIKKISFNDLFSGYISIKGDKNNLKRMIFVIWQLSKFLDSYIIAELKKKVNNFIVSLRREIEKILDGVSFTKKDVVDIILENISSKLKLYHWTRDILDVEKIDNEKQYFYNIDNGKNILIESKHNLNSYIKKILDDSLLILKREHLQKKKADVLMKRFSKYVNNKNLDYLVNNIELLNPHKQDIALLSVDLVDSTKFASENEDSMETFSIINSYLRLVAKIVIDKYGGTLDKFIGDEVMAIFGAPIYEKNYYKRALDCARDILSEVEVFNKLKIENNEPFFNVKIVVAIADDVILGEVGSSDTQLDYTAIGDGVNRFFRIAKFGVANKIIINSKLRENLLETETEFYLDVKLKGIKNSHKIYYYLG